MSGVSTLGGLGATGLGAGAVQGVAALPAVGSAVTGLHTTVGQRIGAALEASKYKAWVERLARGAEGFFVPVSPIAASAPGQLGTITDQIIEKIKHWKNER